MTGSLLPKLREQFAEFLQDTSLKRLGLLDLPTCVGFGYDHYQATGNRQQATGNGQQIENLSVTCYLQPVTCYLSSDAWDCLREIKFYFWKIILLR